VIGLIAVITAVAVTGCACPEVRESDMGYADMASHGAAIAACIAGRECAPLCASVFSLEDSVRIEHCQIRAAVHADRTTQPAPIGPSTDLQSVVGVNLAVMYSRTDTCGGDAYVAGGANDGWSDADWSDDDSSCDDGSCDPAPPDDSGCDDGSCDDDGGGWTDDEPGDDQPGDDGGADDGGADDGGDDGGDGGDGRGGHGGVRRSHRAALHVPAGQTGAAVTRPAPVSRH